MGDVIVDTHCTIKTPRGYLPGIPKWVAEALHPKQVILVEATPKEIVARRHNDPTRARDADSEEDIANHQAMNRAADETRSDEDVDFVESAGIEKAPQHRGAALDQDVGEAPPAEFRQQFGDARDRKHFAAE